MYVTLRYVVCVCLLNLLKGEQYFVLRSITLLRRTKIKRKIYHFRVFLFSYQTLYTITYLNMLRQKNKRRGLKNLCSLLLPSSINYYYGYLIKYSLLLFFLFVTRSLITIFSSLLIEWVCPYRSVSRANKQKALSREGKRELKANSIN